MSKNNYMCWYFVDDYDNSGWQEPVVWLDKTPEEMETALDDIFRTLRDRRGKNKIIDMRVYVFSHEVKVDIQVMEQRRKKQDVERMDAKKKKEEIKQLLKLAKRHPEAIKEFIAKSEEE